MYIIPMEQLDVGESQVKYITHICGKTLGIDHCSLTSPQDDITVPSPGFLYLSGAKRQQP